VLNTKKNGEEYKGKLKKIMTEAATVTEAINGERSKKFTQDNTKKNC
jgi:hypothetical protein